MLFSIQNVFLALTAMPFVRLSHLGLLRVWQVQIIFIKTRDTRVHQKKEFNKKLEKIEILFIRKFCFSNTAIPPF